MSKGLKRLVKTSELETSNTLRSIVLSAQSHRTPCGGQLVRLWVTLMMMGSLREGMPKIQDLGRDECPLFRIGKRHSFPTGSLLLESRFPAGKHTKPMKQQKRFPPLLDTLSTLPILRNHPLVSTHHSSSLPLKSMPSSIPPSRVWSLCFSISSCSSNLPWLGNSARSLIRRMTW